jgi:NitT/TauT family transport system substrate-binding protein
MNLYRILAAALMALTLVACRDSGAPKGDQPLRIRLGHFPNITHAQALVASELSRQGKGWFEEKIGGGVKVEYYVYNAGPSAMEAIFTNAIDLTYVGPNPVLNAYGKSQGSEIRVVAGAATGGAALVVPADGSLSKPEDFRGKRIATPQLGNTQDVACRAWLAKHGYHITQLGGDVNVLPTANPDQLSLFQGRQIDAVWTVEPWVARLELEAQGKILIEEKDALTTVLASSVKFQKEQPELLKKFVAAHAELTAWINEHPAEAKQLVRSAMKELTKRDIAEATVDRAWSRLHFGSEISRPPFDKLVSEAQSVGFLKGLPDLGKLIVIP